MRVHTHAPGPDGHGVVRHARAVARLCAPHGVLDTDQAPDLTHAHFTDALFGSTIEEAARAYRRWAAEARRPLVLTVHDVPDPHGRSRRDRARCAGYAAVLEASDAVIVSAEHEARKITELTDKSPHHIDLPLPPEPAQALAATPAGASSSLVLLGYLYPGKGHDDAIDLAADVGRDRAGGAPAVIAAGTTSTGHRDLEERLREHAQRRQVPLTITGYLTDAQFASVAAAAGVPLVLNRDVSASGSLLSWLSCQRRPVVWAGPYSTEIEHRYPGNMLLGKDRSELVEHISRALEDPGTTRLARRPRWQDTGAEHVALYRSELAGVRAQQAGPLC
jgi:glycosyltransferase involved in cell wall biosynthesis